MKFSKRTAKYKRHDYETNEDILSGLENYPVVKKIQNYKSKRVQHFRRMDRDRQTSTLNYEISTMRGTKPTTTPQDSTGLLVGPEQGRRPITLQAI